MGVYLLLGYLACKRVNLQCLALYEFTYLHSISLFCTQFHFFCTDLRIIDMFLTNQNTEIVACILLSE